MSGERLIAVAAEGDMLLISVQQSSVGLNRAAVRCVGSCVAFGERHVDLNRRIVRPKAEGLIQLEAVCSRQRALNGSAQPVGISGRRGEG